MRPDEDGYELFIPEEDGVVVKKDDVKPYTKRNSNDGVL